MLAMALSVVLAAQPPACEPVALAKLAAEHRSRVAAVCALRWKLVESYVGMVRPWKHADGGAFDPAAHADRCVASELTQSADSAGYERRVRTCIAGFADSGLAVRGGTHATVQRLPLTTEFVDGALVVTGASPDAGIPIGATLQTVGGQPALAWLRREQEVTSASSEATARAIAGAAGLVSAGPLPATTKVVALAEGKRFTAQLPFGDGPLPLAVWYPTNDVLPNRAGRLMEDWSLPGRHGDLLFGRFESHGRGFCAVVLKTLLTAPLQASKSLEVSSPTAREELELLAPFLRRCDDEQRPVLLDLRRSSGVAAVAPRIAALLTPEAAPLAEAAVVLRPSAALAMVLREAESPRVTAVEEALAARRPLTAPLPFELGRARLRRFSGRVVALIGPECTGGCEVLAALLAQSPTAVLAGQPTAGAGHGSLAADLLAWRDDRHGLQVDILDATIVLASDGGIERFVEHQPVRPHVEYRTALVDVTHANAGWWALSERLLFDAPDGGSR